MTNRHWAGGSRPGVNSTVKIHRVLHSNSFPTAPCEAGLQCVNNAMASLGRFGTFGQQISQDLRRETNVQTITGTLQKKKKKASY